MIQRRDAEDRRGAGGDGGGDGGTVGATEGPSADELECKICYCPYSLGGRRPKALECRHRLCAKCLAKILDLGESPPDAVVCPFCRRVTGLRGAPPTPAASGGGGAAVGAVPDDRGLVAALALQSRNHRNLRYHQHQQHHHATTELLLSPANLGSLVGDLASASSLGGASATSTTTAYSSIRGSPNFVVITIVEPPATTVHLQQHSYPPGLGLASIRRPSSSSSSSSPGAGGGRRRRSSSVTDSMTSIARRWTAWNCAALLCQTSARALVWALGLLYLSSLPVGVYLLIMRRTALGVLLVSLVPASLAAVTAYGLCQCVCREFWDCVPP